MDTNDLFFKPCYISCKTCLKEGTSQNHSCITCDSKYEFNLTSSEYYNCYPKCDNYYFDNNNNNYICLGKDECPNHLPFKFQKNCYDSCPANITELSKERNNYCEIKCPKDSPYEIIEI